MSGHDRSVGSYDLTMRRRFSRSEKQAIVSEAAQAGSVSAVARRHGIAPALLFRWRREFKSRPVPEKAEKEPASDIRTGPAFVPVMLASDEREASPRDGTIEITFPNGCVVRVGGGVEDAVLGRVLRALRP